MLLALVATVSLVGCSSKNESNDVQTTDAPTSTEVSTETNQEVAEIDVDNLSAVEIYEQVINNAKDLIEAEIAEINYDNEYTSKDGEEGRTITIMNNTGISSFEYVQTLNYDLIDRAYINGNYDEITDEEMSSNNVSIAVLKAKDGKVNELLEDIKENILSPTLSSTKTEIEAFSGMGDAVAELIETLENTIKNSGIVVINDTIIACNADNGIDILSRTFKDVSPMFDGE